MAFAVLDREVGRPSTEQGVASNSKDQVEWHFVQAGTCRQFHLGELVRRGELLGRGISGNPVVASVEGRVTNIQYDFWREEVILEVTP